MDRRRKLFIAFLVVLVVAGLDMRANGIGIVDQWGRLFEIRTLGVGPGDPTLFARATATYTASHGSEGIDVFVVEAGVGRLMITGADTDTVSVQTEIHTLADAVDAARAYADGFGITLEQHGSELRATWQAPARPENLRLAQMTWTVTVPRDMAVAVEDGQGFVSIRDTTGPIRVETRPEFFSLDIAPAAAAPIFVQSSTGEVRLILDRSAMNYDVDVTARFGELWVSHPENSAMSDLEMTRDGSVATLRGALGDGEFPLVIDVRGNVTIFEPREQGDRILRRPSGS